jgi:hypothetical protein
MERRSWVIAGDATPGGWDVDQDMTWNPEKMAMEVAVDLTAGQFKFRANDDWAINLGDNLGDAILTYDGGNIDIENGSYLIRLFPDKPDYTYEILSTSFDRRGLFYTAGQTLEISDLTLFSNGYAVNKFKNITSAGVPGSNTDYPDTDFPMFRLADAYMMASEAILRGAQGGTRAEALDYFNEVRSRAYGSPAGGISDAELNLQMMIDERAREFYWECQRRTDLVRFNQFTSGDYLWAWKGGVMQGQGVEAFRRIYPIPSQDRGANPNLEQNDGY